MGKPLRENKYQLRVTVFISQLLGHFNISQTGSRTLQNLFEHRVLGTFYDLSCSTFLSVCFSLIVPCFIVQNQSYHDVSKCCDGAPLCTFISIALS